MRIHQKRLRCSDWSGVGESGDLENASLYAMNAAFAILAITTQEYSKDAKIVFRGVHTLRGAFKVGITNSIFVNRSSDSVQKFCLKFPVAPYWRQSLLLALLQPTSFRCHLEYGPASSIPSRTLECK